MWGLVKGVFPLAGVAFCSLVAFAESLPPDATYRPLPTQPLEVVRAIDEAEKPQVMQRQADLLDAALRPVGPADAGRDDVRRAQAGAGRRAGQAAGGHDLGQPGGDDARRDPRSKGCCRTASCRCRTSSRRPAGRCFPDRQIDEIGRQEQRDLRRFDVDFDLPDHLTPEFPPPIFLTTPSGARRRLARPAAHDPELLRAHDRHPHAGADGRPAAAADAVPAGGVQPDRGSQGRRAEPRRDLPRLPLELPHQRAPSI